MRRFVIGAIVVLSVATSDARLKPRAPFAPVAGARGFSRAEARHGRVQTRWPNGRVKSDITYRNDVYEGEYRTWYQSGAPYELRHYVAGREAGVQQSWTEEGELYLNYEVRDGRRYGLVNATPCASVSALRRSHVDVAATPGLFRTLAQVGDNRAWHTSENGALPFYDSASFTPHWSPVAHRIGPFNLTTQSGAAITDRSLKGRLHIASFVYTKCAAVCPILVRHLNRVQQATDALIVSYTVTPDTDTPAALAAFGRERGIDASRWWLVTGDADQIYRLARRSYFADDNRVDGDAAFLHTEKVLLVDEEGRLRGVYNGTQPHEIDQLIADVGRLR